MGTKKSVFVKEFDKLSEDIYLNAIKKGWYDKLSDDGTRIALMHAELSKALEALRIGNPSDDKVPEFSSVEVELADTIIRIMDFGRFYNFRIGEAIEAKNKFNKTRPKMHGNKKF